MNTTTESLNLKIFCNPDRPTIAEPFSEGDWTYYASGSLIVRVPRDPAIPERDNAPKNVSANLFSNGKPTLARHLSELDIPDLEGPDECERCSGTGQHMCDECDSHHECGRCKGTGQTPERPKRVDFNRHRLSNLLLHKLKTLPNVILFEYDDKHESPIGFTFDGGDGRLAPLN